MWHGWFRAWWWKGGGDGYGRGRGALILLQRRRCADSSHLILAWGFRADTTKNLIILMNPRNGFWGRSKILMGPTSLRSSTTQRKQSIWDTYVWKWCLAEKILAPERGARRKCWWKATQVLLMLSWLLWVQSGYIATKLFVFKILTEAQCEIVHPEISRVQDQINKINNAAMAVHIFLIIITCLWIRFSPYITLVGLGLPAENFGSHFRSNIHAS